MSTPSRFTEVGCVTGGGFVFQGECKQRVFFLFQLSTPSRFTEVGCVTGGGFVFQGECKQRQKAM